MGLNFLWQISNLLVSRHFTIFAPALFGAHDKMDLVSNGVVQILNLSGMFEGISWDKLASISRLLRSWSLRSMKKNKLPLKEEREKRRERRRFPFGKDTKLTDLITKGCYGDVYCLIKELSPYLTDGGREDWHRKQLYFDLDKLKGIRKNVIKSIAAFVKKVKAKNGFKKSQSVFFRYLCDPNHCNLGIRENSLKSLIAREERNMI